MLVGHPNSPHLPFLGLAWGLTPVGRHPQSAAPPPGAPQMPSVQGRAQSLSGPQAAEGLLCRGCDGDQVAVVGPVPGTEVQTRPQMNRGPKDPLRVAWLLRVGLCLTAAAREQAHRRGAGPSGGLSPALPGWSTWALGPGYCPSWRGLWGPQRTRVTAHPLCQAAQGLQDSGFRLVQGLGKFLFEVEDTTEGMTEESPGALGSVQ